MTDESMPTTKDDVLAILAELRQEECGLRSSAIAIEGTVHRLNEALNILSKDPAAWLSAFLDAEVMKELGANVDMSNAMLVRAIGLQGLLTSILKATLAALGNGASGNEVERMADAAAAGMVESAASCTCGACNACRLIDARGPEIAVPEIARWMRDTIEIPRDRLRPGSLIMKA